MNYGKKLTLATLAPGILMVLHQFDLKHQYGHRIFTISAKLSEENSREMNVDLLRAKQELQHIGI